MLLNISYYLILGKPLIFYSGILTLLLLLFTAFVGYRHFIGKPILAFKWHPRLAIITIILALIHSLMGLSAYFKF